MPAPQNITDAILQDFLVRSISNVFGTMLGMQINFVRRSDAITQFSTDEVPYVIGTVGFVGNANGLVYLCFPEQFGRATASQMLGMSADEVIQSGNATVNDVIGELTNMTVGGFKNSLSDAGYPCRLTIPTVVRGRGVKLSAIKEAARLVLQFDCQGTPLLADLQLKYE